MKNLTTKQLQYATVGKKKKVYNFTPTKQSSIIRNIEIIVACIVAFMAGTGMYELFK